MIDVRELLAVIAGLIMLLSFVPYAKDILKGKVRPSRSARIMMVLLLLIVILQQHSLDSGWLIAMTVGDFIGAVCILLLAVKRGIGGLTRIDLACYLLLAANIAIWLSTGNTLLALHLSALADLIAMTPVLVKTWRQPWTETPLFFALGVIAPLLSIIGAGQYGYAVLFFPLYVAAVNLLEVMLIFWRQRAVPKPAHLVLSNEALL